MRSRGKTLLDVVGVPRPADDAGVDAADAHAQLSAVSAVDVRALRRDEFRLMQPDIGVQLSLGQRHRVEVAFRHPEVLRGELPTAADGHAVDECSLARGEDYIRMEEL